MKKITVLLLAALLLAGAAGCGTQSETVAAPALLEPVAVTMDTAAAYIDDIYNIAVYSGEIVPYVESVWFEVDGKLDEMKVTIGDEVTEGQVLATLSNETLLKQIADLEAQIAHANTEGSFSDRLKQADIELAKLDLEVLQRTLMASDEQLRAKELVIEQLEAELKHAQELRQLNNAYRGQRLNELKEQLNNNELKAPLTGRIVYMKQMQQGDSVRGFETVICIADESCLQISTDYISDNDLREADQVYAEIQGKKYEITHVPMDDEEYVSKMLSGGVMNSYFALETPGEEIEVGQHVLLNVLDSFKRDVLVVPVNAIYRDERGDYVYRIEDGQRVRQDVTVGITSDLEAEITEGLEEGAVVYVQE